MFYAKKKVVTLCMVSFTALAGISMASVASDDLPPQGHKKSIQNDQSHQHGGDQHDKNSQHGGHDHGKKQGMGGGMMGGGMMGGGGMSGGMGGGSYAQLIASQADALALTDEQLGKITRIHAKEAAEFGKAKHQAHESMHDFMEASMKPATDDETIRKFGKNHNDTFSRMIEMRINERKAVHAALTPEQTNKLRTLKIHNQHDHGSKQGNDHGGKEGHGGHHSMQH